MSPEENKTTARRYIEEIWSRANLEVAREIVAPAFTFQGPIRKVEGLDAFKQFVAAIRSTFPDLHFTIEDLIAENDKVVICWTMTGTHNNEFMGIAPTGKQFTVRGTSVARLTGGKMAEAQLYWDRLGMVEQLGATLTPG